MKVVLSRKGMDAACGGLPSPVLQTANGWQAFPLPIPYAVSNVHYHDVTLFENHTAWDFIKDVAPRFKHAHSCHLDPDLRYESLRQRPPDWQPAFGQVAAAQTHLENNGIGVGDLFLFFGWFQFAEWRDGKFVYQTDAYPSGFHAIYGYLQIGKIYKPAQDEIPHSLLYHPHIQHRHEAIFKTANNAVYTATDRLQLFQNPMPQPGAGMIPFHQNLILTKRGSANRTVWQLPNTIHSDYGVQLSYHTAKSWSREGDVQLLRSASQGQEFVFTSDGAVQAWAQVYFVLQWANYSLWRFEKVSDCCQATQEILKPYVAR